MLARVQNGSEFSDPFPVTNGVKQGCVLAPTLFSMMFSAILTAAFQDGDNGIPIRYRFDEKLFHLRRLQAKSKVQTEVLDEFLFADDIAKGAPTEEKMQKGVYQVSDYCDSYDLTISINKTEVVYQVPYLGSTLSRVVHINDEVNAKIAKASAAFGRLCGMFGIEVESGLTQRWKSTKLWCCQHYCMHAKRGQFTNGTPKDWTTSIPAALENF